MHIDSVNAIDSRLCSRSKSTPRKVREPTISPTFRGRSSGNLRPLDHLKTKEILMPNLPMPFEDSKGGAANLESEQTHRDAKTNVRDLRSFASAVSICVWPFGPVMRKGSTTRLSRDGRDLRQHMIRRLTGFAISSLAALNSNGCASLRKEGLRPAQTVMLSTYPLSSDRALRTGSPWP